MPALEDLLSETMLFTGARGRKLSPIPVMLDEGAYHSPKPRPHTFAEVEWRHREETALHNEIWRFRWNPETPGTFTDVTIRSRGMGMDYSMDVPVFDSLEFRQLQVVPEGEKPLDLYLDKAHMIGAWQTRVGTIHANDSRLWRLESKLDSSLVVVFGYQVGDCGVAPLTAEEIADYGDLLIPPTGSAPRLAFDAGSVGSAYVCVGAARYIVAVELVLCKERPDFVPGALMGFARIHPHVLFWSNQQLDRCEVSIILNRPAKAMTCNEPDMKEDIGLLLVTDTNDEHTVTAQLEVPIPFTDALYDYYEDNPYKRFKNRGRHPGDHPLQQQGEITLADPRFVDERTVANAVRRNTPTAVDDRDIRKCRRQGQFDNIHMASRMRLEATLNDSAPPERLVLDDVVMINQCVHDCVHTHVRWSEFLNAENSVIDTRVLHGWGPAGPYSQPGTPQVPKNQVVFASFPSRHSFRYRAVAQGVKPGFVQVFFHHGSGYAVDVWPTASADALTVGLREFVRQYALTFKEPYASELPEGWTEFYWRVRWTGTKALPIERLQWDDLEYCMT